MPKRGNKPKSNLQQKRRKRIIYTSSSESESDNENRNPVNSGDSQPVDLTTSNVAILTEGELPTTIEEPINDAAVNIDLDQDILIALGETTEEAAKFGPSIHDKLAKLWNPILRKGLNKETKEKLTRSYLVPENCALLQAPRLNAEISAAVSEATRNRDKKVEFVQQQLGQGISALNKGLELLLDDGKDRLQVIKYLSDSCRLLCDLHFVETEARKKFVTPGLEKSFINIMQGVDRDDLLFGNKLSEKIKATKVIEKHGLQIKKPAPNPQKPQSTYQPLTNRSKPSGNWRGPSRFPTTRGGRGGLKNTVQTGRRVPAAYPAQTKPPLQNKQRATTQQ